MITSYKELTINKYLEIRKILEEDGGELNIQSRIIACLADMDLDDVLNLKLTKYNEYVQKTAFLMKKPELTGKVPDKLNINGVECYVTKDVNKITASQYIDYQTITSLPDQEKYLANVLACFIVPKDRTYADGYDTGDIAQWIGDNLSIEDAMNICFFFRKKYLNSIKLTLAYLELTMKRMKRKEKDPQVKEKLKELTSRMEEYRIRLLESGDGLIM